MYVGKSSRALLVVAAALLACAAHVAPVAARVAAADEGALAASVPLAPGAPGAPTPPLPPEAALAYVTGTAFSPEQLWVRVAGETRLLGEGQQPLVAPDGLVLAAATTTGAGPALVVYATATGARALSYGNAALASVVPLAFSADSTYLAVAVTSDAVRNVAKGSSLVEIDLDTGVAETIAHGIVRGASFAPGESDAIAYGLASSQSERAVTNVFLRETVSTQLTHDGRSLNPVWGADGIVYDHERRRHLEFPEYQLWLDPANGDRPRQLTHVHVGPLVAGLVPIAFSSNGAQLLAEFEGQDTSAAWTVVSASGQARELRSGHHSLMAAGISGDGTTVLLDEDSFENPPSSGRIVTMPFAGGPTQTLLAHGGQASWNDG
jgi:hypothetical protein